MSEEAYKAIMEAVREGEDEDAERLVRETLDKGLSAVDILQQGVVAGITEAGALWKANKFFMPDVILAADAFKAAMGVMEPHLKDTRTDRPKKKFVIGVVEGDMHDLGKSLVIAMLQSAGFEVIDLGIDVPNSRFIESVKEHQPDILGMGAYMTTTMQLMKEIVDELEQNGLRNKTKVMVGGVPTSQEFADEIGADAWGKDALNAMEKAQQLTEPS
jgi:5-methyltetrahydrofolate--homocysteine methyltransferase